MAATTVISNSLITHPVSDTSLHVLPKGNYLPYEEFKKSFQLGNSSTEQLHAATMNLSQTMFEDIIKGLEQLMECDQAVKEGHRTFVAQLQSIIPDFKKSHQSNGKIIIVGSGSSGRVAVNLAKKCIETFSNCKGHISGEIAGGDSALMRAKEGFEDSDKDGENAIEKLKVTNDDIVILLSASGSASFNVGAGHTAANRGAKVYYFYNNKEAPHRTEDLFKRISNPVIPLLIDIGAQAIGGSTRLQAATLALDCLGTLLGTVLFSVNNDCEMTKQYPAQVLEGIEKGNAAIATNIELIKSIVEEQNRIRSAPQSNTHRVRDETDQGYVTLLSFEESYPEISIDTSELPPTFNEPFYRREDDAEQKRPGFQAFMLGKKTNLEAWQSVAGRKIREEDLADVNQFLLCVEAEGQNSYVNRPTGKGNMVMGIVKLNGSQPFPEEMAVKLQEAQQQGASTAIIVVSDQDMSLKQKEQLGKIAPLALILDKVPQDPLGLIQTIALKQALNLISNGTMILEGKVHGNRMINMRSSNNKLIDRCMGLVKTIWAETHNEEQLEDRILYHMIVQNDAKMKESYQKGIQPPPIIAITLAMLHFNKTPENFDAIAEYLMREQKGLSFLTQ